MVYQRNEIIKITKQILKHKDSINEMKTALEITGKRIDHMKEKKM